MFDGVNTLPELHLLEIHSRTIIFSYYASCDINKHQFSTEIHTEMYVVLNLNTRFSFLLSHFFISILMLGVEMFIIVVLVSNNQINIAKN